jgi:ribosomal protein L7Ae-like RNA K-turn-binding protein
MRRRCLNHLGLARRAGLVTAGGEKVRAQIASGRVAVLLEAADGSLPERRKLTALVPHAPVVDVFTSSELGAALGRDAVTHVGLADGRLTRTILDDATRYCGLSGLPARAVDK